MGNCVHRPQLDHQVTPLDDEESQLQQAQKENENENENKNENEKEKEKEKEKSDENENEDEDAAAAAAGVMSSSWKKRSRRRRRVKIFLTKDELEWLMLGLKETHGKRLEELLGQIVRNRERTTTTDTDIVGLGWKPRLDSITELTTSQMSHETDR